MYPCATLCEQFTYRCSLLVTYHPRSNLHEAASLIESDTSMLALFGAIFVLMFHGLGVLSGVMALMSSRTSQGAIAWLISLVTFPYLAVPAYWLLGRPRFYGYVNARGERDNVLRRELNKVRGHLDQHRSAQPVAHSRIQAVERLSMTPLTSGNRADLLIDGTHAFDNMFKGLQHAEDYVLIQFFIVRDDRLGRLLQQHLIECAERGVRVCFIYDELGSHQLPEHYVQTLRNAGVEIHRFGSSRGWRHRFQVNFRNHRKVLVVDGIEGWVGGLNVGIEYLGEKASVGPWRDTHLYLHGPAVLGLQEAFWEDWYWATGEILSLEWQPVHTETQDRQVIIVPTGPADGQATASLMVQNAINMAHDRFWVSSPYFVPDEGVQDALKLAALRGVDVRVMIPERPDHLLVYLSAFSFLDNMIKAGVKIYRYKPGFLHQKVMLVDCHSATVGTVNLDNRSFRLNFEITAYVVDQHFAREVEAMLIEDLSHCRQVTLEEITQRPLWRKLVSRAAYLASPIQ